MDEQIRKNASNYFLYFYNLTVKWKTLIEKMQKPFSGLKNLAEQLVHVENANIDEFRDDFPDLKEKLVFKVFIAIDEELLIIRSLQNELLIAVNELRNKLHLFEKSTANIDWDDESKIGGTALHPSLSDLLQLAYQGWSIYNDSIQNLSNAIKSLDVRSEKTFTSFKFVTNESDQKNINEIIALTQYCYNPLN